MKSIEIRQKFFEFFKKHGHEQVASSSLIPAQDPTLLFANAGMNQFKDLFLGKEKRSYTRAVTIQKCMRAGGKHNDLDNVGFTKRHLTFFEMMGNFSFGDYFKKEAIAFAWEFLTKEIGLPQEKLHATVFETDDEAYGFWQEHVPAARITRLGAKDNFWQMGDTGPCGPCTEIYIDRGTHNGCGQADCAPGCSCDRFMEIWNLVFMQFDRQPDGTDVPLKQTGVDTGMGLERLCAVVQGKDSVFEIDLFQDIIKETERLTGVVYAQQTGDRKAAFHVIADHVRAATMLLADGCAPSNEGRGYVLRKIIRRAALFEQKLTERSIFPQLAQSVIASMHLIYPELADSAQFIKQVLTSEIEKFATNLVRGKNILDKYCTTHRDQKMIPGKEAFKLYDTFGFPIELVELLGNERGFTVDRQAFEREMEQQRAQSGKTTGAVAPEVQLDEAITTRFVGYEQLTSTAPVVALIYNGTTVQQVPAHEECWIVTAETPFFAACGGQVDDLGTIAIDGHRAPVQGLKKLGNAIGVLVTTPAALTVGQEVTSYVDTQTRINTMKNHTATHLLQAALIELLGKQVKQSGSVVTPEYLRFDFTHHENLTPEQIKIVEDRVNEKIRENIAVSIFNTNYKQAVDRGVIAIFGEKYNPEDVRVIDIPGFSAELCGGTHVPRTGDIGAFKITEVGALSAGNRRIVAVTGPAAIDLFQESFNTVKLLSQEFKVKQDQVLDAVRKLQEQSRELATALKQLKKQVWVSQITTWTENTQIINGVPFGYITLHDIDAGDLKEISQALINKKPGMYVLMSTVDAQRCAFIAALAPQFTSSINLKAFGTWLQETAGLRGGGSGTSIQGGGPVVGSELGDKIAQWLQG